MPTLDLAKLWIPRSQRTAGTTAILATATTSQRDRRFLKGPIPWAWLTEAAKLPGHVLHIALALWFRAGVTRSETVVLTTMLLKELGVDRHAKYRALRQLEQAGLVSVAHQHGKNPHVTLRSPKRAAEAKPE